MLFYHGFVHVYWVLVRLSGKWIFSRPVDGVNQCHVQHGYFLGHYVLQSPFDKQYGLYAGLEHRDHFFPCHELGRWSLDHAPHAFLIFSKKT
jgi:hypothetical protein